ncbi:MAG TPA: hypothetical protein VES79_05530 [Solirubrobacteraceae bacterium]|nr:hypothetical protein [Solirubrobacteraceae bacterium]
MNPSPARRLVLVPASPAPSRPAGQAVRRYRIARVRLEDRDVTRAERFEHLKRSYD